MKKTKKSTKKLFNNSTKKTLFLVLILCTLITIITGSSYAILQGNITSENKQAIKLGKVQLKLTENFENISITTMQQSDANGLLSEGYEFNIKNIGDSAANFDIKLINRPPTDYNGDIISEEYIKIGLEINGIEHGPMNLKEINNVIDSDIIYQKEQINYKLRVWLDEEKAEQLQNMENYKSFLKLEVVAEQRPESMDKGVKNKTFEYTGEEEKYIVPRDGWYYIEMAGGAGGIEEGAYGAKTSGYIELKAGETLYFYVGKKGANPNNNCRTTGYEFNGGGISRPSSTGVCGATGGSATDVRLVPGNWDDTNSLISRIMVAAGGAGGSNNAYTIPHGGTLNGETPIYSTYQAYLGNKATQISGGAAPTQHASAQSNGTAGSFGKGGYGGASASEAETGGGSGGGSGYYGGSGASGLSNGSWPGGGGSSYISGYAGVNSVENNTTITHTNQTIHYSGKYFLGGKMTEGQNKQDGYATIRYVSEKPKKKTTSLNSVRYIKNCINGDSSNSLNSWIEIQAIKDGVNIAKNKSGSVYDASGNEVASLGTNYAYSYVTDGIIDNVGGSIGYASGTTRTGLQCFIIDLETEYDLDEIASWHYYNDMRTYFDDIVYVSKDKYTWTKIIDETMYGNSNGKRVNAYTDNHNGYIQDNLAIWYDGYANTGTTRNHTSTTWKDLSGSGYNGTLTGCTWYNNNLYFDGLDDTVLSNILASTLLPSQSDRTLSITLKINSLPYTNATYGDTGVLLGAAYYNGMAITWSRPSTASSFSLAGITRTSQYASVTLGSHTFPTQILQLTYVNDSSNGKITSYVNGVKYNENASITGTYDYSSNMGNIGINKPQIMGGSGQTNYGNINVYGAQIYTKALTEEEVKHNYQVDKKRFNLE